MSVFEANRERRVLPGLGGADGREHDSSYDLDNNHGVIAFLAGRATGAYR